VYGDGADERVEHHGGTGGAPSCILVVRCTTWMNFVYSSCHRGVVSLLCGATSSSIIWGDSETECLLQEPNDGAFDDRVFLVKKFLAIFHIVVALTHNECTGGCLPLMKKRTRELYALMEIMLNFLYYYSWRAVSEVHKLVWILTP
jgi:hypothetical protein